MKKVNCVLCKIIYEQKLYNQKFCSKKCRNAYSYRINRKPPSIINCLICNKEFEKRSAKNTLCKDCTQDRKAGIKAEKHTIVETREYTKKEQQMLQDFLTQK